MMDKFFKWLDHNRYFAILGIVGISLIFYTGCSELRAVSPVSGEQLTDTELSAEYNRTVEEIGGIITANEDEIARLMRENGRMIDRVDGLDDSYDVAFADLEQQNTSRNVVIQTVFDTATAYAPPGSEMMIGTAMQIATGLGLFGVIVDNRRKDKLIKNGKKKE